MKADPFLTRCLQISSDARFWQGWIRTSEGVRASRFLVRFDPVGGYLALGGLEIHHRLGDGTLNA